MNNTKWREVREAMLAIDPVPRWRTRDRVSGYVCDWDSEWYYHFQELGYDWIEWVEIWPREPEQMSEVIAALRRIGVPGKQDDDVVTVLGFVPSGGQADKL